MPASIHSSSIAVGKTGSTFSVTAPSTILSGDILVAFQLNNNSSAPAAPTGWSNHQSVSFPSGLPAAALTYFYKAATGSEPGSYTFNNVGSLDSSNVYIICVRGCTVATEDAVSNNSGVSSTETALAITTISANSIVLAAFANITSSTISPNGSLISIGSGTITGTPPGSLSPAYLIQSSAGTTGNQTATAGGSGSFATIMLCFSPASPPVVEEMPWYKRLSPAEVLFDNGYLYQSPIGSWINTLKTFKQPPWKCNPLYSEIVFVDGSVSRYSLPWFHPPVPNSDNLPWRRKLIYQPEPETEYTRSKTLLPLQLQILIFTSQEGVYGIFNTILMPAHEGVYRIANNIEGYNLYIGSGSLPDLTASPAAFSQTLPFQVSITPPVSGLLTLYVLVRSQDQYGLQSQNSYYQTITIDSTGGLYLPPDSPPQELTLYPQVSGFVRVLASYPAINLDLFPADYFQIFAGATPPNVLTDVPVAMIGVGSGILSATIGPFAPGTIYVAVTLWRTTDSSQTSAITSSCVIIQPPSEVVAIPSGYQE